MHGPGSSPGRGRARGSGDGAPFFPGDMGLAVRLRLVPATESGRRRRPRQARAFPGPDSGGCGALRTSDPTISSLVVIRPAPASSTGAAPLVAATAAKAIAISPGCPTAGGWTRTWTRICRLIRARRSRRWKGDTPTP